MNSSNKLPPTFTRNVFNNFRKRNSKYNDKINNKPDKSANKARTSYDNKTNEFQMEQSAVNKTANDIPYNLLFY